MAKRKAKKSSGVKSQPKANPKANPKVNPKITGQPSMGRFLTIGIIAAAALVLVYYAINGQPTNLAQPGNAGVSSSQNSAPTSSPPATGIEIRTSGVVEASKAKIATFKVSEISAVACFDEINKSLTSLGGIGKVRVDYTNKLCEIEYDSTKVTEDKILEAIVRTDHPATATSEKIAAP